MIFLQKIIKISDNFSFEYDRARDSSVPSIITLVFKANSRIKFNSRHPQKLVMMLYFSKHLNFLICTITDSCQGLTSSKR